MTGPNTSFWTISSSWRTSATTVGSKKKPRSPTAWPPVSTSACAGSGSTKPLDPLQLVGVVERAEVGVGVVGPATVWSPGLLDQGGDEVVVDAGPASTRVAAVQSWPALK